MGRGLRFAGGLLMVSATTTGCWDGAAPVGPEVPAGNGDPRFELVEDETALAARVATSAADLPIDIGVLTPGPAVYAAMAARAESGAKFTLVAEVRPPAIDGDSLEATRVSMAGSRAYVSYGKAGSKAIGAIDVFDVSNPAEPRLKASARFTDSDIFTLSADGSALYCGENSSDPSFASSAVIERVGLSGGRMSQSTTRSRLTSYATTGVDVHGNQLFVTTGDDGGISLLDRQTLDVIASDDFTDARDLDRAGNWLVAVQGQPGRLRIYDSQTLELLQVVDLGGLSIPESKASVLVDAGFAFVSLGDGGTAIVDLRAGGGQRGEGAALVATIPRASVPGVSPEASVTNAVTVLGNNLIHANGGAGVWVTATKHLQNTPSFTPLGRIAFEHGVSANFVAAKGQMLFVAAGRGGLKIVRVH